MRQGNLLYSTGVQVAQLMRQELPSMSMTGSPILLSRSSQKTSASPSLHSTRSPKKIHTSSSLTSAILLSLAPMASSLAIALTSTTSHRSRRPRTWRRRHTGCCGLEELPNCQDHRRGSCNIGARRTERAALAPNVSIKKDGQHETS